jgi:hypothetical protein
LWDGEHDEQQRQGRRHEQPEHVAAGIHDVADEPAHRTLIACQKVALVAGHHALPSIRHLGAPHSTLFAAFLTTELGSGQ